MTRSRQPVRALCAGALAAVAALSGVWPAKANAQIYADLACPCRVETSNLTSVRLTFGVRNFRNNRDSGPIRGVLEGRVAGEGEDAWERLATVHLPPVAVDSLLEARQYAAAFRQPDKPGSYELRLGLFAEGSFRQDLIYWMAETMELPAGGGSFSSVYFDGTPTVSIADGAVTLNLPEIRSAEAGTKVNRIAVSLARARGPGLQPDGEIIARHAFGRDLEPGGEIAAATVTAALDSPESGGYLQLRIEDGEGNVLAFETVQAPEGEELPARAFSSEDASMLPDSDGDGVTDVNERLTGADPHDPESAPGDPTIDVLALYSPGIARLYDGDPTTRISHTMTLAATIFRDSNVGARLRLVGIAPAPLDEADEFADVDADTARELMERHGADVGVMYRPFIEGSILCGWARLAGFRTRGTNLLDTPGERVVHVFGDCGANTTAHEIGHAMGLGHSYAQRSSGTWRWSRGHGIRFEFATVMAYRSAYGQAPKLDLFSTPDKECDGWLCGIDPDRVDGADAVKTLRITRFQVAGFAEEHPDSDGDGFVDPVDAFPDDPGERVDSDGDGTGDNADNDDDNDGVADAGDAFPTDPAEWSDRDGDGVGDKADDFPDNRFESADTDGDGVGDKADAFPDDPGETVDTDNDGVGNNRDAFPYDTREWLDTDGDGIGDNADEDADNDGVADAADPFPADASRSAIRSYRLLVTDPANRTRRVAPAGDIDGDGKGDFLVGLTNHDADSGRFTSVAYLAAAADLAAADAADGAADRSLKLASVANQPGSWKFIGETGGDRAGHGVAAAGDLDGDGRPEFIIGAPAHGAAGAAQGAGAAYVVSAADLAAADSADGAGDGTIRLAHIASGDRSWKLVGEAPGDRAGGSVAGGRDLDGDGNPDLVVGAPGQSGGRGAAYVVSGAQLGAADLADGTADGVISLENVAALTGSWKLTGQDAHSGVGDVAPVPHAGPNGAAGLIVTSAGYRGGGEDTLGAVYLAAAGDLAAVDAADGGADGVVELGRLAAGANSRQFLGARAHPMRGAASLGDIDGDGRTDVFLDSEGVALLVSGADLDALDGGDGTADGVIRPHDRQAPNSWRADGHEPVGSPATAGDMDGDDLADLALLSRPGAWLVSGKDLAAAAGESGLKLSKIPTPENSWQAAAPNPLGHGVLELGLAGDVDGDGTDDALMFTEDGEAYLLVSADLRALDRADADADGRITLTGWLDDTDDDGIGNLTDEDDDNDGYSDFQDRFPLDPGDWADTDDDGIGNNADAFPADATEQLDTDGDGTGDNADTDDDNDGVADGDDSHPLDTDDDGMDNALDADDDGDGVADGDDRFPLDPDESADTDRDGIGDNADTDDDNDGVSDSEDALPLNPDESADADGDGIGDNADAFPMDVAEWRDTDGDGTGDNADADDDNDGVSDGEDALPLDPDESADTDGDGIGDNADAFPMDAAEWNDTDGDGTGDNADTDDDGDAYTDAADEFPLDPERTRLFHYRLVGGNPRALAGYSMDTGDIDGDGRGDALIGAPGTTPYLSPTRTYGAVYAVSATDLDGADRADGARDGVVALERISTQPASRAATGWGPNHLAGLSVDILGDVTGDGKAEWLAGSPGAVSTRGAAYLVSPPDLDAADDVNGPDGIANLRNIYPEPHSVLFLGRSSGSQAGRSVASAGDTSLDLRNDVLIGAPREGGSRQGAAYLVSTYELRAADAADGAVGGAINLSLISPRADSWIFRGEPTPGQAGWMVGSAGDIDGDGAADLLIGAPWLEEDAAEQGALYLVASADLSSADTADGSSGSVVQLANVSAQPNSWKFIGEGEAHLAGLAAATGDIDGDGSDELIVGAPGYGKGAGAVYVLPIARLAEADSADGAGDHVVRLGEVTGVSGGWKLTGDSGDSGSFGGGSGAGRSVDAADIDGDGRADLLVGAQDYMQGGIWCAVPGEQRQPGAAYLLSGADFASADAADGVADGKIRLSNVATQPNSWQLTGEAADRMGTSISASGDLDGDGRSDLLLGAPWQFRPDGACGETSAEGVAVALSGAELAAADRRDGVEDGVIDFEALRRIRLSTDFDFDGQENELDNDDDNDGVADTEDAFPLDPAESADNDHDGIGDNADPDDDNDGVADANDAFPFEPQETAGPDGGGEDRDDGEDGAGVVPPGDASPDLYFYSIAGRARTRPRADFDADRRDDLAVTIPGNGTLLVSSRDLKAADAADGATDRSIDFAQIPVPSRSWKLKGQRYGDVVPMPDLNGGGLGDWIVGDLVVSPFSLSREDERDGASDRSVGLSSLSAERQAGIWRLGGEQFVSGVYAAGDLDGDRREDLLVGGRRQERSSSRTNTAAYVVSGTHWPEAVGNVNLEDAAAGAGSWKMRSEADIALGASIVLAGDVDGDGHADLAIGAPDRAHGVNPDAGGVLLLSGAALNALDGEGGSRDGVIEIAHGAQAGIGRIAGGDFHAGESLSAAGDVDGDGRADLLIGAVTGVHLITGADLPAPGDGRLIELGADSGPARSWSFAGMEAGLGVGDVDEDGLSDVLLLGARDAYLVAGHDLQAFGGSGVVDLQGAVLPAHSWRLRFESGRLSFRPDAFVADIDADGSAELVLQAQAADTGRHTSYVLSTAELAVLDRLDGKADHVIHLDFIARRWSAD